MLPKPELSPAEERHLMNVVHNVQGAYLDGFYKRQSDIDAVLAAYEKAMTDEKVVMPSFLHAAIEALRT